MKNIIIGVALVALFSASVASAGLSISVKGIWGKITTPDQITDIYRVYDMENKVMCYYSYVKGASNATPSVDCVKL